MIKILLVDLQHEFSKIDKVRSILMKCVNNYYYFIIVTNNDKYDDNLLTTLIGIEISLLDKYKDIKMDFRYLPYFLESNFNKEYSLLYWNGK
jgi:hypothetical protein